MKIELIYKSLLLIILYFITGKLGLYLAVPPGYATLIWPPSGIAIGMLVMHGWRLWPGVLIGSLLLNSYVGGVFSEASYLDGDKITIAAIIAVGSTIQAMLGRLLVEKILGLPLVLKNLSQTFLLFLLTGPLSCLIAATVGVSTLIILGDMPLSSLGSNWLTWWLGDIFGVFVFLPLMLVAPGSPHKLIWRGQNLGVLPVAAMLLLVMPLGLTFYVWKLVSDHTYETNLNHFERLAVESQNALTHRVESYSQGLRGGVGFFGGSDTVTREEWSTYVRSLNIADSYPGISGMGYIENVSPVQLDQFLAHQKKDIPDFKVHPLSEAPEKFIVTYFEPNLSSEVLGLNIAYEDSRRQAAMLARDLGKPVISNKVNLSFLTKSGNATGFLLLQPLYKKGLPHSDIPSRREAIRGWVYAPFISANFMNDISEGQNKYFQIKIFDGMEENPAALIYESGQQNRSRTSQFLIKKNIHVMEKTWTVIWSSTQLFEDSLSNKEPIVIMTTGLLFVFMLGAFLILLSHRAETVRRLVSEQTAEIILGQQALKASEETFRLAMENASIGKALLTPEGKWIKVNKSLCDFLGYSEEEFQSNDFQTITHPDDLKADTENVEKILSGEISTYRMEKRYIHKQGHIVWGLLSVSLLRNADGSPKYFISQIQDISELKRIENIKSEFISIVSHELRTPVTSIHGSLGLIQGALMEDLPEQVKRLVTLAYKNSQRLISLINQILDMEKMSSGKMKFDMNRENITSLIRRGIEENFGYAEKYNVKIDLETDGADYFANTDSGKFLQVLSNLLSNAAKFSPSGSIIKVTLAAKAAGRLRVSVTDSGEGVPTEFQKRIFGRFSQADSSVSRKKEGSGLGLHISREIIEEMGGGMGFVSSPGQGATFWFEILREEKNDE